MTLSTIGASAATPASASSLGLQDLIRVLATQLSYQDPLKPMANEQFMAQVAQFTALEQTQQLNDRMQMLVDNAAALQSIGLIGRSIDFSTANGRSTGTVTALSFGGNAPVLSVSLASGTVVNDVALSQLLAVH